MATVTQHDDDELLPSFGYKQQFVRSLRHFESFAVAFSFISITTGIFTTYAFARTGYHRGLDRLLLSVGVPALQRACRLVARLDVVRVPDHRHGVG